MAMEPSKAIKEYKDENVKLQQELDEYAKKVGKMTIELEWTTKKLKSLDLSNKKALVESKLTEISLSRQCELINLNRSNLYYSPIINQKEIEIKNQIQSIYEEIPCYGYIKVYKQLLEDGFSVSPNTVHKYRKELGLRAVLAV